MGFLSRHLPSTMCKIAQTYANTYFRYFPPHLPTSRQLCTLCRAYKKNFGRAMMLAAYALCALVLGIVAVHLQSPFAEQVHLSRTACVCMWFWLLRRVPIEFDTLYLGCGEKTETCRVTNTASRVQPRPSLSHVFV